MWSLAKKDTILGELALFLTQASLGIERLKIG